MLTGKRRPVDTKLGCMYPRQRMQEAASVMAQLSMEFGSLFSCTSRSRYVINWELQCVHQSTGEIQSTKIFPRMGSATFSVSLNMVKVKI